MATALPTKAQFVKATDLTLSTSGKRTQDATLQRIDELLDAYARTTEAPAQLVLLGRLFYATDFWLKKADRRDADVNTRRRAAVFDPDPSGYLAGYLVSDLPLSASIAPGVACGAGICDGEACAVPVDSGPADGAFPTAPG